jgi:hypothetical protein
LDEPLFIYANTGQKKLKISKYIVPQLAKLPRIFERVRSIAYQQQRGIFSYPGPDQSNPHYTT